MITDIHRKNVQDELNTDKLEDYWQGYFHYQQHDAALYQLVNQALLQEVESAKSTQRPYVDSQQTIGKVLTEFGKKNRFHRVFREQYPDLHSNQILGMHLYHVMVEDDQIWIYNETRHAGHLFSHATYFISRT